MMALLTKLVILAGPLVSKLHVMDSVFSNGYSCYLHWQLLLGRSNFINLAGWPICWYCSSYAYSQIRFLSLPISQALGLFTVVLPLITGISTQGAYGLIQRFSRRKNYQLTIPLIALIGFQLIYETIIATLATTYILPPSALGCGLDKGWQSLYAQKNEKAIRTIQDSFNCCGLNTLVDRAFPFSNDRSKCPEIFGRNKTCFADWRKAEQTNAGLFLLVALVVFLIKVIK